MAPLGPKKSRSKRPSKTNQILIPFQHRFLSDLAPFWRAKMALKSIKNPSKSSFQAFLFPHRFLHRFFIDFSSNFDSLDLQKVSFSNGKTRFFQKTSFEDNIDFGFDFGANLPPCWPPKSKIFRNYGIPRGLENLIFFRIDFLSILGPSWPPAWGHLGGQDGSKLEKLGPKKC